MTWHACTHQRAGRPHQLLECSLDLNQGAICTPTLAQAVSSPSVTSPGTGPAHTVGLQKALLGVPLSVEFSCGVGWVGGGGEMSQQESRGPFKDWEAHLSSKQLSPGVKRRRLLGNGTFYSFQSDPCTC